MPEAPNNPASEVLTEAEIEAILDSVLDVEFNEACRRAEWLAEDWYGEADAPPPVDTLRDIRHRWHAFTVDEQLARIRAAGAQQYLVEGLLPMRSTAFMVGDSGIGKSPLLYQLGLCVAAGIPFFGHATTQGPVLYFDYENNIDEANQVTRTIAEFLGLPGVPDSFIPWNAHDAPKDWNPPGSLFAMIRELRPKLVIIDTLSKAFSEVEEKNSLASALLTAFTSLVSEINGDILVSHHFKKNMPKKFASMSPQDKMKHSRGASSLFNGVDLRLVVAPPRSGGMNVESFESATPVECCFEVSGFRRLSGDIEPIRVERVQREGDPLGYRQIVGVTKLRSPRHQAVFDVLPDPFRYKDVEGHFPNSNSSIDAFLKACKAAPAKIIQVELPVTPGYRSTKGYKKVVEVPQPERASMEPEDRFDPHDVLGVSDRATPEEIHAAWRDEMAKYHPDKVAHLGAELQELARRKALDLNRAYAMLQGLGPRYERP